MLTVKNHWGKAWGGYLLHFWISKTRTLCGKTHLIPCRYGDWHTKARSKCKKCKKRLDALLIAREKEAAQ